MNYNVNFRDIIYQMLPFFKRKINNLTLLYGMIKSLKTLNSGRNNYTAYSAASTYAVGDGVYYNGNNYICIITIGIPEAFTSSKWSPIGVKLKTVTSFGQQQKSFLGHQQFIDNLLKYNSQILYLEKYLNTQYDPVNNNIYIENVASTTFATIYNKVESQPKYYLYNKWQNGTTYALDDYIVYAADNHVYKSLQNANTGNQPDITTAWWDDEGERVYFYNIGERAGNYDFIVYIPTSVVYDTTKITSEINLYKLPDKRFIIVNY